MPSGFQLMSGGTVSPAFSGVVMVEATGAVAATKKSTLHSYGQWVQGGI